MKRGKEFNNILDECLERLLIKGETIEQCLASYPEHAAELEPLLQTAVAAKKVSAIQPSPEFKARARYQFRSALREVKPKRGLFLGRLPQWATVVTIVLILLLAGGGTVAAASYSMPDTPLYPVKMATEQARLTLTRSDISKAELYAKLADRRVAEIIYLANKGEPQQVEQTAQRLDTCLAKIVYLVSAQERNREMLMAPPPKIVPGTPEPAGAEPVPAEKAIRQAKLRIAVARYAINHPAALRAALNKAPESTKPALRRAIAISVAGYEKALKAVKEQPTGQD